MSELEPTRTYSNHTATEVLRRLLTEEGIEWKAWDGVHPITVWHDETYSYEFVEYRLVNGARQISNCPSDNDGHCELTIKLFNCTPAQAIAATLGTGTCKVDVRNGDWYCDACGEMVGTCDPASELFIDGNAIDMWKYCPFCGRRIEQ